MLKMFWGVDKHYPPYLKNHYFLVSANALWKKQKPYSSYKFIKRSYDRRFMILDSGGYSLFSKFDKYPFTKQEYLKLINHYRPLAWIPMDYPCEPELLKRLNQTVEERIASTLDNLIFFMTQPNSPPGLLAVIQGYTLKERLNCFDMILDTGLKTQWLAIGSLCALANLQKIHHIVNGLSDYAIKVGWEGKFHLFGLTIKYLKKYTLPNNIISFDTSAWGYKIPYKDKKSAFANYKKSISPYVNWGYYELLNNDGLII